MEKIYIIEDDENIRNLLKIALEGLALKQRGLKQQKKGWSVSGRNARPWRSSTGCSRNGRGDGHPADPSDRGISGLPIML